MKNCLIVQKQSGLSLIELLIAMFVGLFLLAGISTTYISSKKSSIDRDQYSTLEDNGRIALEIISDTLQHAGYVTANSAPTDKFIEPGVDIIANDCRNDGKNILDLTIFPEESTFDNDDSDSIGGIFLGDSDVNTDCSGEVLPADCQFLTDGSETSAAKIYNTFFVDTVKDELRCAGSRSEGEAILIAEGVENMQILYGIQTDDGSKRYVSASNVNGLWNSVVNIQVGVLVRSLKEVKQKPEIKTYSLLDVPVVSPNDRYERAVFTTTISLRNP